MPPRKASFISFRLLPSSSRLSDLSRAEMSDLRLPILIRPQQPSLLNMTAMSYMAGPADGFFFKASVHSKKIEYKQASDPSPCEIYGGMLDAEDLDQKN